VVIHRAHPSIQPIALSSSKGIPSLLEGRRGGLRQAQPERKYYPVATACLLLAACGRGGEAASNQVAAAPPAKAPQAEGDVGKAERLVRERLGNPEGLAFTNPRRGISEGVTIICGDYEQGGNRQRYIVVGGEEVFVEPGMQAGEMDRAFTEFCGDGERA
jgi:hypothetical protein